MIRTTILAMACLISITALGQHAKQQRFSPGKIWEDTEGTHINAHGGGMLFHNGTYYWFGEHKTAGRGGNRANVGVRCYSSQDLYNWTNEGVALPVAAEGSGSDIEKGSVIERPKVIYNASTGKFVMWFHLELKGQGYNAARTGVAVSDRPEGPYTFLRSLRPNAGTWPVNFPEPWKSKEVTEADLEAWSPAWRKEVAEGLFIRRDFGTGQMSRDMGLFVDDDGKAYHIHSAEENLTLHISELTDDYLGFTGKWAVMEPAGHNEAPALFKKDGKYYMVTSGCTGWDPNAARSFVADHIMGPWKSLGNPAKGEGASITFDSQSTYVLPVQGKEDAFIFMADRWEPQNAIDGRYVWLPIEFNEGKPELKWHEEWSLDFFDQ
ncbi:glycoside hydrolase family 43 protein [Echinicola vietnamensis]|uniref:Beta-xylosidase n=1 Tax=Echinicola vietnamensis (strain DSM 17526 / LMG 23754 / KMM 6221) TaxID=926556 RepID=L0G551_ECHVK|nr:glycoside hydrolase family 43 protein [Echinicola vietnamensis]AGA80448.1 beta-xylosidase [Echinicola vietnamensis DSM 17526]